MPYELKHGHNATEATKTFVVQKGVGGVDHSTVWLKKFHSGSKNLDDKASFGRNGEFRGRTATQIRQVALQDYRASWASHSSVRFVSYVTLAKESKTAELCLTLPKYWKTFDSPSRQHPFICQKTDIHQKKKKAKLN